MTGWLVRLFAAMLVLGASFAAGCSAGDDASSPADVVRQEETTSPALADGKIVVASNVAYPPFEFAPRTGPKGFDIDLMNEIADRMDLEVQYRDVQFDSLLRGLSSELFDAVISGMTITETRRQQVDFSDPYYNVQEALVVRAGSGIESTGDLEEEVLGVQPGTMGQAEAGELLNAGDVEEVRTFDTIEDAFAALENEVIDGVIYDLPAAQEKVDESNGELELVETIPTGEQYGIALPKESPLVEPVNQALAEIKEDGTYEEIYKKWIGRAPEEIP
ncbi:transporter substrate-binding domain-containing protein [Rubrobacter tropicus]|uniref:Transporter substrate-binding domain-containing protein n=1 Tax=Rubrobacter tropicus TaxID=2653851 RepID=A0A6G8Q4N0_9ACTN|nr:basic amino acid ABC transporter substrate-binding protein [Rubrobacter tropicus]QIN81425.1 transporter substrate-binding domain-containing protein [Rubrobacter tropicus]